MMAITQITAGIFQQMRESGTFTDKYLHLKHAMEIISYHFLEHLVIMSRNCLIEITFSNRISQFVDNSTWLRTRFAISPWRLFQAVTMNAQDLYYPLIHVGVPSFAFTVALGITIAVLKFVFGRFQSIFYTLYLVMLCTVSTVFCCSELILIFRTVSHTYSPISAIDYRWNCCGWTSTSH